MKQIFKKSQTWFEIFEINYLFALRVPEKQIKNCPRAAHAWKANFKLLRASRGMDARGKIRY